MAKRNRRAQEARAEMDEEQLPWCPKCGGEGRMVGNYLTTTLTSIYCKRCGYHVSGAADTIEKSQAEAIKAWTDTRGIEMPGSGLSAAGGLTDED